MEKFQQKVEIRKLLDQIRRLCDGMGTSCNWELIQIKKKLYKKIDDA